MRYLGILAGIGLLLAVTGTAGAAIVYVSDNGFTPGIVTYVSAVELGYPTPHKLDATETPQTIFDCNDRIFAGSQISITALDLNPDGGYADDLNADGFLNYEFRFYKPDSTFVWAESSDVSWGTFQTWSADGYTSAQHWSADSDADPVIYDLWDATPCVLGTWTVEDLYEGVFYDTHTFEVVPEPATMALMALGGIGMLVSRKRK